MARAGARLKIRPGAEVATFMAQLEHPHRPVIEAVRQVVHGADPGVAEGIKWNASNLRRYGTPDAEFTRIRRTVGWTGFFGDRRKTRCRR